METVKFIEKFIVFIEDNLREEIDFDQELKLLGVEHKSFNTIFSSLVGSTPLEYQTKRRLSEIAYELYEGHRRMVDIIKYYGYRDVDHFKEIFQKEFGISAYDVEKNYKKLNVTNSISFEVVPTDAPNLLSTTRYIPSFRMVGVFESFDVNSYSTEKKTWLLNELEKHDILDEILEYNNGEVKGLILYERYIDGKIELFVGVSSTYEAPFDETYTESSQFVIFESQGPLTKAIPDVYKYIYRKWRFKTNRELNANFSIEVLKSRYNFEAPETKFVVWQPIYE